MKDPSGKNLFMCCCTDLALESRDYELLFGRMDPVTGLCSSGLLDQFNSPHIDSKVLRRTMPNLPLVNNNKLSYLIHIT